MTNNPNLIKNSVWQKKVHRSSSNNTQKFEESKKYYEYDHPTLGHIVTKLALFNSNTNNKMYEGKMVVPKNNGSIRNRMFLETKHNDNVNDISDYETYNLDGNCITHKYYNINHITTECIPEYVEQELYEYEFLRDSINNNFEIDESEYSDESIASDDEFSSVAENEFLDISYDF